MLNFEGRVFHYKKFQGKIISTDADLSDFHIRCLSLRTREGKSARWILNWRGMAISFAEHLTLNDFKQVHYTDDGRRIIVLRHLGLPDKFTWAGKPFDIPWFSGFSSMEEQSEAVSLTLSALSVFESTLRPHMGCKCLAVLGDELEARLSNGEYLA